MTIKNLIESLLEAASQSNEGLNTSVWIKDKDKSLISLDTVDVITYAGEDWAVLE